MKPLLFNLHINLLVWNGNSFRIQRILDIFRHTPARRPVIPGLNPDPESDIHRRRRQVVHVYDRLLLRDSGFLLLRHRIDHIFGSADIRFIGDAHHEIHTPSVFVCHVGEAAVGKRTVRYHNQLVVHENASRLLNLNAFSRFMV
nr:MAG TPA: hypothetical protein [Caudoviricetes sp.]